MNSRVFLQCFKALGDTRLDRVNRVQEMNILLTFCVRGERFCDGFWLKFLEDGLIFRLRKFWQGIRDRIFTE